MKWNIITHNIRGFNDLESIAKERRFLNTLAPKADIVMIQEHKLRGRALDNLGPRLMPGYTSWILEAAPGEQSWINPSAAGKGGVGILITNKLAKLVTANESLYDNRVVWVKMEGVEGENIGLACIYAPNIPTDRRHLWYMLMDALPKECEWIIGGDFNMTERPGDKSHDCGRAISDLERGTWHTLLNTLQVNDQFICQGGPRYSWDNEQSGERRKLARLDRFYTPTHSRLNIHLASYYIHRYCVGSDHSPIHLELHIRGNEVRKTTFKWNVSYLKDETMDKQRRVGLLRDVFFP